MARFLIIAELNPLLSRLVNGLKAVGHACLVVTDPSLVKALAGAVGMDMVLFGPDECTSISANLHASVACYRLHWQGGEVPLAVPLGRSAMVDAPLSELARGIEQQQLIRFRVIDTGREGRGAVPQAMPTVRPSHLDQRQLAHDIKNLLTIICASARSASTRASTRGATPAMLCDELDELTAASERAVLLMRKWLASDSRVRVSSGAEASDDDAPTGGGRTGSSPCHDLRRLVSDVEPLLRRCLRPGIELGLRAATRLPRAQVDPVEFERVLINLVINACDALPQGGHVDIDIDVARPTQGLDASERQADQQPFVRMTVADDGVGMAPDVARRIFDPSFTTKRAHGGSGLGLSAVRSIVERSRGVVEVDTRPAEGTRLTVYLPAVGPAKQESGPRPITGRFKAVALTERSCQPCPPAGGVKAVARKILVVDDEAPLRHLIVELLHGRGYEAIPASDGRAALRLAASLPRLDLLICDIRMPGRPGWEIARELSERRGGLPVLFTSGHAESSFAHERAQIAQAEFLAKPFRMETLLRRVRQILDVGVRPRCPPSRVPDSVSR